MSSPRHVTGFVLLVVLIGVILVAVTHKPAARLYLNRIVRNRSPELYESVLTAQAARQAARETMAKEKAEKRRVAFENSPGEVARRARYYILSMAVILALGAWLRIHDLSNVPTGSYAEEIDEYNSVYSIVTTGHDVDGKLMPYLYQPNARRNAPLYPIVGYGSTLVFGKNAFALRLPAALFGIAAIVLMYFLAFELTRRRDVALVAALVQAIAPLFVHFSRISWTPASIIPFLLAGLWLLILAVRRDKISLGRLTLAAFLLGLTSYTYIAAFFYAPLLGGAVIALNARRLRSQKEWALVLSACAIWLLISIPALWVFRDDGSAGSIHSILTFGKGINGNSLHVFFANYFAHFWWDYLVKTGATMPGHISLYLVGFGAFYWWVVLLAIIGAGVCLRHIRRWEYAFLLIWLLAYPLGGALTDEGVFTNAARTLAGAPVFCVMAGIGFALIIDKIAMREWRAGLG